MADISKIVNIAEVLKGMQQRKQNMIKQTAKSVVVGFTASYAMHVHENVEMKWKGVPRDPQLRTQSGHSAPWIRLSKEGQRITKVAAKRGGLFWDPQGKAQAKFLEEPARRLKKELQRIVVQVATKTNGSDALLKGMLAAGLRLIRESAQLVPVDTGNLKNSWFVKIVSKSGGSVISAKGPSAFSDKSGSKSQ